MRLLLNCLLIAFVYLPEKSEANNLQINWQKLYQQAWQSAALKVTPKQLEKQPQQLLISDSLYPNFQRYTWQEIQLLWQIKQACQPPITPHASLTTAIEFELSLCNNAPLSEQWFVRNPLIHPAGGSFAERYLQHHQHLDPPSYLLDRLTIRHHKQALNSVWIELGEQGVDALLQGYRAYLKNSTLWLNGEQGWKALAESQLQALAKRYSLSISVHDDNCSFRYSNLCINQRQTSVSAAQIIVVTALIFTLSLLIRSWYMRHLQRKEQHFILQLLTHELRTPVTSLGLTIEMFREKYDSLNKELQDVLFRLIQDYQRLAQLTEVSRGYLSDQKEQPFDLQETNLQLWLTHICEKHKVKLKFDDDANLSLEPELPLYWLNICLDNLITNAKQHGSGAITVKANVGKLLSIDVCDQGEFYSHLQCFIPYLRPSKSTGNKADNLGIGLHIVAGLMKKMGGKLVITRNPTRCRLELPL